MSNLTRRTMPRSRAKSILRRPNTSCCFIFDDEDVVKAVNWSPSASYPETMRLAKPRDRLMKKRPRISTMLAFEKS